MKPTANFVAIDLGASSGRLVVGQWDGNRFTLEELHRFANEGIRAGECLYWDVLQLWTQIKAGLAKYAVQYKTSPAGISVDTWGVDFALLDKAGSLLGNPHHYRDPRTDGIPEQLFARIPKQDVFHITGIQSLQINTLFQLYGSALAKDPRLQAADTLLMMPDLFTYLLSGQKINERTIASTSEMLDCREGRWARGLIEQLGIPSHFLGEIVSPGTRLAPTRADVMRECGLSESFPVIAGASHDTASAVAAIPFLDEHSAFISSGTWSLMGVETRQPVTTDQALALEFTNESGVEGTIRLLKNVTGLWLVQECVRQWRRAGRTYNWDEVVELAREAEPLRCLVDPDAPDFMAPENMPDAIRAYCCRTGQPQPETDGQFARCCFESLALKYRSVVEALKSLTGRELHTIRVVGGGSSNPLLCQLTADACGCPVIAGPVEASSLGNVMVQAVATGCLNSIAQGRESIAASCGLVTYEPVRSEQWGSACERFRRLEERQCFLTSQA